ncbi:MAG TPA: major capsid protein [Solirubrobacteraceae bacterium]|jgi:hypothetical protein
METIRELLGRLNQLTAEELTELRAAVVAEFDRIDGEPTTPENVAILNELADAGDQVIAESTDREAKQAQAESDKEAAKSRIAALKGEAPEETEEEKETPAEGEPEAEPEETPEAEVPVEEPEPVAASGSVARMAAAAGKPAPSPEADAPKARRVSLTATGALRGLRDPSSPIEDRKEFATALAETLQRLPRHGSPRGDVLIASARWDYPEERQLGGDAEVNTERMEAVTGMSALTASGGICAPVNIDFSVPTWATADRPLRDGLPSFQATRGGIRFVQPPDITGLAGATGIWTAATDASPGAATKPVLTVACGSTEEVLVEAIPTRLQFGNMQGRFAPEQVAANTDLAMAAAARIAENNLLEKIAAKCVKGVANAELVLGATRDLLTMVDQVRAQQLQLHRLPDSQVITAIFPRWVKDLIRIDLLREVGHDNSGDWNVLRITDAQVEELLRAHGINAVFHLDGQPGSVEGGVSQVFAEPAKGTIKAFPTKLVWYAFPEGTMQFLDAGRLDLGVVRDATLDATNDYETFIEPFEGLAYRGYANGALQLVSSLCANGASAGTVSTANKCA